MGSYKDYLILARVTGK